MKTVIEACEELRRHEESGRKTDERIVVAIMPVKNLGPLSLRRFRPPVIAHKKVVNLMKLKGVKPFVLVLKAGTERERKMFKRKLGRLGKKEGRLVVSAPKDPLFEVMAKDPAHLQEVVDELFEKSGSSIIMPEATK